MVEVETPRDSFRKLLTHPLLQGCVLVALAVGIAWYVEIPGRFPDPDSFYHAAMAELAAEGRFPTRFPWLDLTTLRDRYADLHLVYHLALVPFVKLFGTMAGIRIATIAAFGLLTAAFFGLLRTLAVRGAFAMTLLLLGTSAFAFRMHLAKSQGFAFAILFLGLAALARRSRTGLFLTAVLAAWVSAAWPVLLVAVLAAAPLRILTTALASPTTGWRPVGAAALEAAGLVTTAVAGIAAAFIVHPYFPENLIVAKQQIIDIALLGNSGGIPVGTEWSPLGIDGLLTHVGVLLPLLVLAILGIAIDALALARTGATETRDRVTMALTVAVCTVAFVILTLRQQRQVEFLVPFAVLTIGLGIQPIIGWWWPPNVTMGWRQPGMIRRPIASIALVVALIAFGVGARRGIAEQRMWFARGYPATYLRGASEWLRTHAVPGSVVFHGDWDNFPALFLWDRTHRYLIGLDPRFAVLADAPRAQRWQTIARGEVDRPMAAIGREFGATYALATTGQEALADRLSRDPLARLVYTDDDAKIYELKP